LQGLSPKENREVPPLNYPLVHRLKRERPELQIAINGGIASEAAVREQLAQVDGVMIGRAAYHDPYLLHRLDRALFAPDAPLQSREQLLRSLEPNVRGLQARG
ncbi:MAG: tRNA-dihydrouridine synthase, partial [bacterium]